MEVLQWAADFSPAGQDEAVNRLFQIRNMVNPAMQGDLGTAIANGKKEWASLPENFYKQGGKTRMKRRLHIIVLSNLLWSANEEVPQNPRSSCH
jgi:muramidase (phage lysozyme)